MFSSTGLFKHIHCPNGEQCRLTNCIFSHDIPRHTAPTATTAATKDNGRQLPSEQHGGSPPPPKRRRLETDTAHVQNSKLNAPQKFAQDKGTRQSNEKTAGVAPIPVKPTRPLLKKEQDSPLKSTTKSVSPPAKTSRAVPGAQASKTGPANGKAETLNPRMIPNDPAGHGKRTVYLKALHNELQKLNEQVGKHSDAAIKELHLLETDLIKLSLDEEEKHAREQPTVYANVIKLQIVKYKKMAVAEWIELRRKAEQQKKKVNSNRGKTVDTGLTASEEVTMLRRMITKQQGLDQWGYVTSPPTEQEIETARAGVEASGGYEECDRCKSRFQVFPDRREDGALTSGGKCVYHWGRPFYPKREKTDAIKGAAEPRYICCNEPLGSKGCTEGPSHVYKISEAKRLATVLPFEVTSSDVNNTAFEAVCFDCEMGYTVYGLELIRLTAVSWPEGHALLDVLVRPVGAILDLNSRFSGVFPEQMANATELDVAAWKKSIASIRQNAPSNATDDDAADQLQIVNSPAVARSLLTALLNDQTLLVGHALENDLNSVRLVHPRIVDTVFLYPHPRGLPFRFGLRQLASQYLERNIQTAGAAGHSSLEDARATGDVARWKVKKEWDKLRLDGWKVRGGEFFAPGEAREAKAVSDLPEYKDHPPIPDKAPKKKRKRSTITGQLDGAEQTSESDRD